MIEMTAEELMHDHLRGRVEHDREQRLGESRADWDRGIAARLGGPDDCG